MCGSLGIRQYDMIVLVGLRGMIKLVLSCTVVVAGRLKGWEHPSRRVCSYKYTNPKSEPDLTFSHR